MDNIDSLCMNCFSPLTAGSVCGECGFDNDTENDVTYLPVRSILSGRFIVGKMISQESDAAIYSGFDTYNEKPVLIREFLPTGFANRLEGNKDVHVRERYKKTFESCKVSFTKLWNALKTMQSLSAVVPVIDVLEENCTVYAIIEKMDSITLRDFLLKLPDGTIEWDKARIMFMPVLTTLEALHDNGIIHGSITPDNLLLCPDGRIRLRGFSIGEANELTGALEFNLNEGYTAIEQYENSHKVCPATDIYSFAACIYRALVGTNPPAAPMREQNDKLMIPNRIAESIPTYVIKALGSALQIYPEKRCQSISRFRELLNASPSVVAAAAPKTAPTSPVQHSESVQQPVRKAPPQEEKNNKGKVVAIILVILILAAIGAGVYIVKFSDVLDPKETTAPVTSVATATVPNFISAGYTQSDIENNGAWNKQFKITFNAEYSKDAQEGIIFKQSVEAGKSVSEGTAIILTVSKGIEMAEVPDVGGLSLKEATDALEKLGFTVSSVSVYNDGSHDKDTVKEDYGCAPAAGEQVAKGSEVILQVYGEVVTTTEAKTTEDGAANAGEEEILDYDLGD